MKPPSERQAGEADPILFLTKRKHHLILIISLLLISGFAVTSLASFFVSRASLREKIIQRELPLISDTIYSEIQRDLLQPIFISSLMANDTFVRDWVIGGESDERQLVRYLFEIKRKYKTFTSFFVSEHRRIYYHSEGILKTVNESEERDKWYFRVRSMTPEYEINVDPDMANKDTMTIFINYKVYDYLNNFIGATGVGLQVGAVKETIEKYQKDYDRTIYFVNKSGKIMLQGTNREKPSNNITDLEGISALSERILSGSGRYFKYKRNGEWVHLRTRFIPEFNWILLVELTEKKAVSHILKTLMINLAICTFITLVILFLIHLTLNVYQKRLEKMATIDKLTGIFNRQAFDLIMDQIIKDIRRNDRPLSVILFDIDHFKKINDQYGHLAGDEVIRHIVDTSRKAVRESDILCRWGGEEFLILLKKCGLDHAFELSEKIRNAVRENPAQYQGRIIPATISLGVCRYRPPEDRESLIARADALLYKAKQGGRNRSEKK